MDIRGRKRLFIGSTICILLIGYWFCLPDPLFNDAVCVVLEDREGKLLGARIAEDGQWRFPHNDHVPDKFEKAIIAFEDKRFYYHPGIDPVGIIRALYQNIKAGYIVSGGSTLTMQVIRLSRKGKSRTLLQKLIECILATRLEIGKHKRDILAYYASNAPFGGNIVGLDAASWRYFGKEAELLSWAEAAMLAVLPNSPALIHPGRNRDVLLKKRNRLLNRLYSRGRIDSLTYILSLEEALPEQPHALPNEAPHLLELGRRENRNQGKHGRIQTTLSAGLQKQVGEILKARGEGLSANGIHNLAAMVVDLERGSILAYHGNVAGAGREHGEDVDIIQAPRSTGSILKPILYALMVEEGQLLPNSLIEDVPLQIRGYKPENFNKTYDGVVSARQALVRSLNVPFVRMLQDYGVDKFHYQLKKMGFSTLTQPPDHYGLTLILGGAEARLWDITSAYCNMGRVLNTYTREDSRYSSEDWRPLNFLKEDQESNSSRMQTAPHISASASWFTLEAMRQLERPDSEGNWMQFSSRQRIGWKTGTSFGFRDAWAVGVTPRYAVGVWAGNADGEGRPGLVGVKAAAPVLFDIFNLLPGGDWFVPPYDDMIEIAVCRESHYRALDICPRDTIWVTGGGPKARACPYHQLLHLDEGENWQVNSGCEDINEIKSKPWFVLPPLEAYYYKKHNPYYVEVPPFKAGCESAGSNNLAGPMQLIYPKEPSKIYVPVDLNGRLSRVVFEVAHRKSESVIYWHLDNKYIGSTKRIHQMEFAPSRGRHRLTVVDKSGNRISQTFEILEKE